MKVETNKQIMAQNIQRYMDQRGISRQQLCDALDIKYTTLRDWLKGITYPRIGKVEAMANYFGCEKSDLIEEKMTEEIKKDNDTISSIVVRMTTDKDFLAVVESLYALDSDQIKGIQGMLKAFNKDL